MRFIEKLDDLMIKQLDKEKYFNDVISSYVTDVIKNNVNKLWGKDHETRIRQLRNYLRNQSFIDSDEDNEIDLYIENIANLSEKEVRTKFVAN